ncbi:LtfC-like domain-containing protein [Nocardia africana]
MLTLGDVVGRLNLALDPAADFVGRIELQQPIGTPIPWPAGTAAWLHLTTKAGFSADWVASISGAVMSWDTAAEDVAAVPLSATAELWLDFPDSPAFPWLRGPVQVGCPPAGFGQIVAVPGISDGAVAVPVPGPAGPPGSGEGGASVIVTGTAGAALSGHRAVVRNAAGVWVYADNQTPGHIALPIGITTGAASSGTTVKVLMFGEITEPSWSWTPGPVFLGAGGALTQSVPGTGFLAQVAAAISGTTVFVDRSPSVALT